MASVLTGCNLAYGLSGACTDELRSAIRVDVVDSVSGTPAAAGASVWLRSVAFADSVLVPDTVRTATAQTWWEDKVTAGTYSVEVRKPGYRPWTRSHLRVEANRCHVTTFAFLTARLQH